MKKKTKCYIYTRVSTAIQVDGYSLDAQKDKLKNMQNFRISTAMQVNANMKQSLV